MRYIERLTLPSLDEDCAGDKQFYFLNATHHSSYPFHVFSYMGLFEVEFDTITIVTGGNGTGKSTLLNVIAQKLGLRRQTPFNRTEYFDSYLTHCDIQRSGIAWQMPYDISEYGRIITSDEVFDHMLDQRIKNEEIDEKRRVMLSEINRLLDEGIPREVNMEDRASIHDLLAHIEVQKKTKARYVRDHLGFNILERSNGENAFKYFTDAMKPQGLYLLDEPENSLSAERQIDLGSFIESMADYEHCQFVISTHSPFLMSMKGARLYNLDVHPAAVMPWTEVSSVKTFFEFFRQHEKEFNC